MKLFIFPDPNNATCILTTDDGKSYTGVADTHPTGRPGQSFNISESTPDGNGCLLEVMYGKKVTLRQRAILFLESSLIKPLAMFAADDFKLVDEKVCPEIPPTPVPIPPNPIPPPSDLSPEEIIHRRYATGKYNLKTKEGCGQFTEDCCEDLHIVDSDEWGHIKKSGAQNQYNGHAVDAIQLLHDTKETKAGIYDIIFSSESEDAKPVFNRAGDPNKSLWYYPA